MEFDRTKYLDRHEDINEVIQRLPHWHQSGKLQFVTFHLSDSLPNEIRRELERRRENWFKTHPKPWAEEVKKEYARLFSNATNHLLDNGYGECILRKPECAESLENTLWHFNEVRYLLHNFVIMPNHIHVLYECIDDNRPEKIVNTWKQYSTRLINRLLGRKGKIWSREFYDRIIRDDIHYSLVAAYIDKNIKSGGVRWLR